MMQNRREFLGAAAAAATALAWYQSQDVTWTLEQVSEAGWSPGVESHSVSTCLVCPGRCGIRARVIDGRLVAISGNPLHPVSRGGVCPRGIGAVQMLYHPDRLTTPRARAGSRGNGEWHSITPPEAIAAVVEHLRELRDRDRPQALAVVAGHCPGSMRDLWNHFLRAFGSSNYIPDDHDDGLAAVMELMHGIARRPAYDLERSAHVLSFGAALFDAWWSPLQAYVAFGRPGLPREAQQHPTFVQVDTRFSRTAAYTNAWVGIRPGTYGVLALGIAYVLINEELFDADFVARYVSGFEDYVDASGHTQPGYRSVIQRNYRTEEVSAITGVPVQRIVELAKAFGLNRPSVAVAGADVLRAPDGLLAGLAVHSLNTLVGNINRAGGVMFGVDPPVAALGPPVLDDTARRAVGTLALAGTSPPFGAGDPALRFAKGIASGNTPPPDVLFLYYSNPFASSPQPELWRDALARIPFVVDFSPFMDETAAWADLVLPDAMPYERWQDVPQPPSYPYPVFSVAQPMVMAPTGVIHSGEVLLAVARGLGGTVASSMAWPDMESVLKARARGLFAAQRGMTFGDDFERAHLRQMEERGWWLREYDAFDSFWDDLIARGGWTDLFHDEDDPAGLSRRPGGRIDLMPDALQRALDAEARGRRLYVLDVSSEPVETDQEFPLRLIPYRLSTLSSGTLYLEPWLAEQPTVFADRYWRPWVEINPATAAALGFDDQADVWVRSQRGRYRARLKLFAGTAPGTLCAPYGPRHSDGTLANPLQLLDGSTDPLTEMPCWFTSAVRLEPA